MRLFVAIHFSDEIRRLLLAATAELREQAAGGNFTDPANLHLTLAFIGETNNLAAARAALDSVVVEPFTLTVGGSGRFGELYWAGVERSPELAALARQVQSALRSRGFRLDDKPFKPHITLARQVRPKGDGIALTVPRRTMTADHIALMKSERLKGKLIYTELHRQG